MRQNRSRTVQTCAFSLCDGLTKLICVPIYYDGGKKVQTGHAVVLSFRGSISYLPLPSDAQRIFQRMMGLAFIQPNLRTSLHVGIK